MGLYGEPTEAGQALSQSTGCQPRRAESSYSPERAERIIYSTSTLPKASSAPHAGFTLPLKLLTPHCDELRGDEIAETPTPTVHPEAEAPIPPLVALGVSRWHGTGRRKMAVARVYMQLGQGRIVVNKKPAEAYFPVETWCREMRRPLVAVELQNSFDITIVTHGGGVHSQRGAASLGIARALVSYDPGLRPTLRHQGLLTRDSRAKERKKYGQKGARKKFQWTKR